MWQNLLYWFIINLNGFSNVTNPVIEKILYLYSVFGSSIYKIHEELKTVIMLRFHIKLLKEHYWTLILLKNIILRLFQGITCLMTSRLKLKANGNIFWPYSTLNWIQSFHSILLIQKVPKSFTSLLINPHVTNLKNQ